MNPLGSHVREKPFLLLSALPTPYPVLRDKPLGLRAQGILPYVLNPLVQGLATQAELGVRYDFGRGKGFCPPIFMEKTEGWSNAVFFGENSSAKPFLVLDTAWPSVFR